MGTGAKIQTGGDDPGGSSKMRRQSACLYSRERLMSRTQRSGSGVAVQTTLSGSSRRACRLTIIALLLSLVVAKESAAIEPFDDAVEASCVSYGELSRHLSSLGSARKCCCRDRGTGRRGFCTDEDLVFVLYDVNNGEGFNASQTAY